MCIYARKKSTSTWTVDLASMKDNSLDANALLGVSILIFWFLYNNSIFMWKKPDNTHTNIHPYRIYMYYIIETCYIIDISSRFVSNSNWLISRLTYIQMFVCLSDEPFIYVNMNAWEQNVTVREGQIKKRARVCKIHIFRPARTVVFCSQAFILYSIDSLGNK